MSSPFAQDPNPYAATVVPPASPVAIVPAGKLQTGLEYMRAYHYIFENPTWTTTVLLIGVTLLAAVIPGVSIVLQLLFFGYAFEVIDWLLKTEGRQYPTFDFSRIGDYFSRGLWPFLVNLVASLVFVFAALLVGVGFLAVGAGISTIDGDFGELFGGVLLVVAMAIAFVASVVANFYLTAMMLRSGLAQDFTAGFNFTWVNDFVRKMWVDMILAGLFIGATALALYALGLLALCIGLLFVIPLVLLAGAHLMYQLYAVYLSRGGMPVPSPTPLYAPTPLPPMPPGYPPK